MNHHPAGTKIIDVPIAGTPIDRSDGSQWETMTALELRAFVEHNPWTYARTMPKHPHEYVLLWNSSSEEGFFRFVMTIRRLGYDEYFYTRRIRYLDVDGRRYWTMGDLLETTWVLNRALNTRPDVPMVLNGIPFVTNPPDRSGRTQTAAPRTSVASDRCRSTARSTPPVPPASRSAT